MRRHARAALVVFAALACAGLAKTGAAQQEPPPGTCVGDAVTAPAAGMQGDAVVAPFARADVKAVAERITCYCGCPHLQVSKCFCGTADKMRSDIAARLDNGESPDAVVAAFVEEHGTWILGEPPKRGFNWIIWIGPIVLLVGGAAVLLWAGRRWMVVRPAPRPVSAPIDAEADERYRTELARLLEQER